MAVKTKQGVFYRWGNGKNAIQNKKSLFHTELGPQGRLLLWVNTLFLMAEALSGTFVNVYLWKEKNDYGMIAWYNIAFFLAMQVTFMFAGKWVKEHNKMSCLRTGIAVAASFYLLVLITGARTADYIFPLGFLQGVGHGFFWFSFNIALFEITNRENRDKFNGLAGVFGSLVGMVTPLLAGYLISEMTGMKGYTVIFSISLGIYITGVILSFFLKRRESEGHYSIKDTYKILGKSRALKNIFLAMVGQGLNESVFGFLVGLLVFIATKNEWKLGIYTFITSGVSFFSFYVIGKLMRHSWRNLSLLLGTILTSIAVIPLFFTVNYTTLLVMGIGISLFNPLFLIPAVSTVFDTIGRNQTSAKYKVEAIVLRETGLNIGRLASLLLFLFLVSWRQDAFILNSLLFVTSLGQFITWFYLKQVKF
jgi:MFS transporter, YQGE family, putative transporter